MSLLGLSLLDCCAACGKTHCQKRASSGGKSWSPHRQAPPATGSPCAQFASAALALSSPWAAIAGIWVGLAFGAVCESFAAGASSAWRCPHDAIGASKTAMAANARECRKRLFCHVSPKVFFIVLSNISCKSPSSAMGACAPIAERWGLTCARIRIDINDKRFFLQKNKKGVDIRWISAYKAPRSGADIGFGCVEICEDGGIGRRASLRGWSWFTGWGFDPPSSHFLQLFEIRIFFCAYARMAELVDASV